MASHGHTVWANLKNSFLPPTGTTNRSHVSPISPSIICFNRPSSHKYPISCLSDHSLNSPNSIFPYFPYLNLTPSNPSIKFGKGHQEPSLLILHTNLCLQTPLNYEQNYLGTLALLPHHLQIHHFFFALHISCNMSSLKMGPMSPRPMRTLSCEF